MIYMREKPVNRRRQQSYRDKLLDNLRTGLSKSFHKTEIQIPNKDANREENNSQVSNKAAQFHRNKYTISKDNKSSNQNISESIVIHDVDTEKLAPSLVDGLKCLQIEKCLDISIKNQLFCSRYKAETYIYMLERQKELQKVEIERLKSIKSSYSHHIDRCTQIERQSASRQEQICQLKASMDAAKQELETKELIINKFIRFFQEGKRLFLSNSMELIDTKNQLNIHLSQERLKSKEKSINRCIERNERILSVYTNFLQQKRSGSEGLVSIQQLLNTVKYQEKIIQLLNQNQNNSRLANIFHENTLLRYEVNRISEQNEQFLTALANSHLEQQQKQNCSSSKETQEKIIHQQVQTEEEHQTPFQRIRLQASPQIETPLPNLDLELLSSKLKQELAQKTILVENLMVEKQYISGELEDLEKECTKIRAEMSQINREKHGLMNEIEELKVLHTVNQVSYQVSKQSEKVLSEQNELLKNKIRILYRGDGKQPVTVEELLKFLNKKEMVKYHQALIELITRYEKKISELNKEYLSERESKDHHLHFCKQLFNTIQSQQKVTLSELLSQIAQYQEIMAELKDNQIDVYLRKIKSFSIGIDHESEENIKSELEDYVYQLQIRMPTLSEEYFEDGSSVNGSLQSSVEI